MYKTVDGNGEFSQVINKSTFIGYAEHIETIEQALEVIAGQKKKYPDARHCCWAYLIGENMEQMRYSDDGEPQGTAGLPILEVLRKREITNTVITVTRYFGGILLGTGGLTRAYSSTAAETITRSSVCEMSEVIKLRIEIDYQFLSKLKNYIEKLELIITDTVFTEKVTVYLLVKTEQLEKSKSEITNLLNGKCVISEIEKLFYAKR